MDTATTAAEASAAQLRIEDAADSTFDPKMLEAVAARLVQNRTFVTGTLSWYRSRRAFLRGDSTGGDPEHWQYAPPAFRDAMLEFFHDMPRRARGAAPRGPLSSGPLTIERTVAPLARAGVRFLTGTDDAPIPGFAVHREMITLVEDGLSPLQALQAATINPALALRMTDSLGTVAQGNLADLVLLDANPLTDIHNIATIRAVVADGRYFDRAALDSLLRQQ